MPQSLTWPIDYHLLDYQLLELGLEVTHTAFTWHDQSPELHLGDFNKNIFLSFFTLLSAVWYICVLVRFGLDFVPKASSHSVAPVPGRPAVLS